MIADFTNFNIVTSDSVSGAVTLRLKDVPWDQALDIILQAKGLGMRKTGNVLWIAPKDEIAAKEKLDLESRAAIHSLEPLRTQSFQLNYTKAADVAAQMTAGTGAARILSPRGSVIAEPRTNQMFVTDIPSRLEQVQNLIAKLDIAVRQVLIEARIVEASDTFGKSIGARLGGRPITFNGSREHHVRRDLHRPRTFRRAPSRSWAATSGRRPAISSACPRRALAAFRRPASRCRCSNPT